MSDRTKSRWWWLLVVIPVAVVLIWPAEQFSGPAVILWWVVEIGLVLGCAIQIFLPRS